jgi:Holliday junction resolvasome RuvABC DNA-binding subunit
MALRPPEFTQQKSPPDLAAPAVDAPDTSAFETATRGLTNMGFGAQEAKRAVAAVRARRPPRTTSPSVGDILREALAALS